MEFDEHEDPDVEMGIPGQTSSGGYDTLPNSRMSMGTAAVEGDLAGESGGRKPSASVRYRECLKNHAVGIGGNAVDGCGEFMAAGEEGTLDALHCAACNCHRNFHRKEVDGATDVGGVSRRGGAATALMFPHAHPHHSHPHHQFSQYYRAAPPPAGYLHITPPRPLALPAASGGGAHSKDELEDVSNPSSSGGGGSGSGAMGMMSIMKKRFRTKFTAEQKEKMFSFAERLGWRIQTHDAAAVEQFCLETGVKRHVLKVWMHNNKHTLGKKP